MFRNFVIRAVPGLRLRLRVFAAAALILLSIPAVAHALTLSAPTINISLGGYFTWGIAGASGYGIRDNAGTLQFKNSGGSWASLSSIIGSSNAASANSVPWSGISGKPSGITTSISWSGCGGSLTTSSGFVTAAVGNGCGADVAERYFTDGAIAVERGYIVALSERTSTVRLTVTNPVKGENVTTPYEMTTANVHLALPGERERIIGAVPTRALDISGGDLSVGTQLVTLTGHIPIHVTLENGPIAINDPITLSASKPGYGMKATTPGRIIGYALGTYARPGGGEAGGDMIEVFVHLDEWHPTAEPDVRAGFTMVDRDNGSESCVTLVSGELKVTLGACP